MIKLIINNDNESVRAFILKQLKTSIRFDCAVAYFADSTIIDACLDANIKVKLLVSLTPPTNPFLLKQLLPYPTTKIEIKFLTRAFHSKLTFFTFKNGLNAAIIGSSNYTNGGLENNIETNVYLSGEKELLNINDHFNEIWSNSPQLSPVDINKYIPIYQKAMQNRKKDDDEIDSFEKKNIAPRVKNSAPFIRKEGLIYYEFWKCVDEVKELVKEIKLPKLPIYLTIDHFWHWIKVIWDKNESQRMKNDPVYRKKMIPLLFKRFLEYDGENYNWIQNLKGRADFFHKLLNQKDILLLTRKNAKEIYNHLNSGGGPSTRFAYDDSFVSNNDIAKIRSSLNYLLYSDADIAERISRLAFDPEYKLSYFGKNNIQELIGWVHENMPPRNDKASTAIELIGYEYR